MTFYFFFYYHFISFMELSTSTGCVNLHKNGSFSFVLLFFKTALASQQNCVKHNGCFVSFTV